MDGLPSTKQVCLAVSSLQIQEFAARQWQLVLLKYFLKYTVVSLGTCPPTTRPPPPTVLHALAQETFADWKDSFWVSSHPGLAEAPLLSLQVHIQAFHLCRRRQTCPQSTVSLFRGR